MRVWEIGGLRFTDVLLAENVEIQNSDRAKHDVHVLIIKFDQFFNICVQKIKTNCARQHTSNEMMHTSMYI